MRAVIGGRRRPVVVANGGEGEPASRKDQLLMTSAPHLVLDGALLAAAAVGADEIYFAILTDAARRSIHRALGERFVTEPGMPRVRIVSVPDLYIAGEERSVVNIIGGGPPIPTSSPPRPFEHGVSGRPTLIQNVETLGHLSLINRFGPGWFRSLGTSDSPGTTLVTLAGAVGRPGVYEIAIGTSLSGLLEAAQGTPEGIEAVLVGGYAGTWLTPQQVSMATLDPKALGNMGGTLGCGAIIVLPQGACGVNETAGVMKWLSQHTADQCGPCVHGLAAIAGATEQMRGGNAGGKTLSKLSRWAGDVEGRGACRLPDGAVRLLRSSLNVFAADLEQHLAGRPCHAATRPQVLPFPLMRGAA
jgi:NADH:ubiquinone oxidoreductase subunit F (NADH-binding)